MIITNTQIIQARAPQQQGFLFVNIVGLFFDNCRRVKHHCVEIPKPVISMSNEAI
jgi:hypothetical protein